MVQYGRPSRFRLSEISMVVLWQDCYGKGNLRNPMETRLGEGFQLGMLNRT